MRTQSKAQPKAQPRKALRFRVAYVVLAGCLALFAYAFILKTHEIQSLVRQQSALQRQNQSLTQENARVRSEIRYDRTPSYVEETARNYLNYTKPGDVSVQVQSTLQHPVIGRAPVIKPAPPQPSWKQWWRSFFG
ncbi:MAG: FtsB family cell division protein [Chloroflexota bacterium]